MMVLDLIMISITKIILNQFKMDLQMLFLIKIHLMDYIYFFQIIMLNLIIINIDLIHHLKVNLIYLQHKVLLFHLENEYQVKLMLFMVVMESILLSQYELLLLILDLTNLLLLKIIIMLKVMFYNDDDLSLINIYLIKNKLFYLMKLLKVMFINKPNLQFQEFNQYLYMDMLNLIYHYFLCNNLL